MKKKILMLICAILALSAGFLILNSTIAWSRVDTYGGSVCVPSGWYYEIHHGLATFYDEDQKVTAMEIRNNGERNGGMFYYSNDGRHDVSFVSFKQESPYDSFPGYGTLCYFVDGQEMTCKAIEFGLTPPNSYLCLYSDVSQSFIRKMVNHSWETDYSMGLSATFNRHPEYQSEEKSVKILTRLFAKSVRRQPDLMAAAEELLRLLPELPEGDVYAFWSADELKEVRDFAEPYYIDVPMQSVHSGYNRFILYKVTLENPVAAFWEPNDPELIEEAVCWLAIYEKPYGTFPRKDVGLQAIYVTDDPERLPPPEELEACRGIVLDMTD